MAPDKHAGPWYRPRPSQTTAAPTKTDARVRTEPVLLTGKRRSRVCATVGWETDVPRCQTCKHFREAGTMLINSLPRRFDARCTLHSIRSHPMAICDTWKGRAGEVLDATHPTRRDERQG